jgi:hypothetical protein
MGETKKDWHFAEIAIRGETHAQDLVSHRGDVLFGSAYTGVRGRMRRSAAAG